MIEICETSLPGVLKIRKELFQDHRGIYRELYNKQEYFAAGVKPEFVTTCYSASHRNVLRGLHGDSKTWKLISCTDGSFYLVVLNYDSVSSYFGRWESFILTEENCLQVLIPPMHANGHLILTGRAEFHYHQSEYYTDGSDQFSVKWDDPRFNIVWPTISPILSSRDGGIKKSQ